MSGAINIDRAILRSQHPRLGFPSNEVSSVRPSAMRLDDVRNKRANRRERISKREHERIPRPIKNGSNHSRGSRMLECLLLGAYSRFLVAYFLRAVSVDDRPFTCDFTSRLSQSQWNFLVTLSFLAKEQSERMVTIWWRCGRSAVPDEIRVDRGTGFSSGASFHGRRSVFARR